jgi:hypothetical protein
VPYRPESEMLGIRLAKTTLPGWAERMIDDAGEV